MPMTAGGSGAVVNPPEPQDDVRDHDAGAADDGAVT
jgi:hypothetical protein